MLHRDGWLRTGDIGEFTGDGLLRITDRKKDLIKTSGGKYVAPQSIEAMFKATCPLREQLVVHGEDRKFRVRAGHPRPRGDHHLGRAGAGAGRRRATSRSWPRTTGAARWCRSTSTRSTPASGRWETIKKFEILRSDLTVEAGDLTPSLKIKRKVVEDKNRAILDGFYKE